MNIIITLALTALLWVTGMDQPFAASYTFTKVADFADISLFTAPPGQPQTYGPFGEAIIDYNGPSVAWSTRSNSARWDSWYFVNSQYITGVDALYLPMIDCCDPGIGFQSGLEVPLLAHPTGAYIGYGAYAGTVLTSSPEGQGLLNLPRPRGDAFAQFEGFQFGSLSLNKETLNPLAINQFGQVAFWTTESDGLTRIYRADPVSSFAMPEPTTVALLASGLAGLAIFRRRCQ
jgi:hypothetical protein